MSYLVVIAAEDRYRALEITERYLQGDVGRPVAVYHWSWEDKGTCAGGCRGNKRLGGWTRHPKWGFTTHECGRRNPHWRKWFRRLLFDYFGKNLLSNPPEQFQNPESWRK